MIKKLKLLQIEFSGELKRYELPAFRAAIAKKAGHEHILFHNHTQNGLRNKYPLIQYKQIYGKPAILCIEEGVDEIHHFFKQTSWEIKIGEQTQKLSIKNLNVNQFTMQVWDKLFSYSIINWLALNSKNYVEYQKLIGISDQLSFLENLLTSNILSFAKGISWTIEKNIEVKITEQTRTKQLKHKGVNLSAFDLKFSTNVFLPNYIGLGKGASFGFGTIKQIRK